jgi:hypothetical protein
MKPFVTYVILAVFTLLGLHQSASAQADDVLDDMTPRFTEGVRGKSTHELPPAMQAEGTVQAGNFVPGFDGNILYSAVYQGQIYVAGFAQAFNDNWNGLVARWNASQSRWEPVGGGLPASVFGRSVNAMVEYDGKLYVGGNFSYTDPESGQESNLVAWDGESWSVIGNILQTVNALETHNGKLMIGTWTSILEYDGTTVRTLPGTFSTSIFTLRSHGDDLLIGGDFTSHTVAGTANRMARLKSDGSIQPMGSLPMNNYVYRILPFEDEVLISGFFTTIGSDSVHSVAAFDKGTESWKQVGQGLRGTVQGLLRIGSEWVAYGRFRTEIGGPFQQLARFDGVNWVPIESTIGDRRDDRQIVVVLEVEGVIHASLGNINNPQNVVTYDRLVGGQWQHLQAADLAGRGVVGQVAKVLPVGNTIYAVGNFIRAGLVPADRAAMWNDETGWRPMGAGFNNFVRRMVEYRGEVIVGGDFTFSGTTSLNRVARWNGSEWQAMGSGFNSSVQRLRVHNDTLYSVGNFILESGNRAAYWSPSTSSWTALNFNIVGTVFDIVGEGDQLAVAGGPTMTEGSNVMIRSGGVWRTIAPILTYGTTNRATVRALAYHEGILYAAASNVTRWQVYRYQEQSDPELYPWFEVGGPWSDAILDMAVYKGELHIGGFFFNTLESGPNQIVGAAKWDADRGEFVKLGGGLNPSAVVNNLTPTPGGLYISGGNILYHGTTVTSGFSKWIGNGGLSIEESGREVPQAAALTQNYPNPFNPSTVIGYQLAVSGNAKVTVYDVLGRQVAVLVDGVMPAGSHTVTFDASNLTSGVYLYRLEADGKVLTRKMMLVK